MNRTSGATATTRAAVPGQIRTRNRARILKAAEEVFAERGYQGATTAAIAERARLPKANVHYYFGTKAALYQTVIDDILELWLAALDRITEDRDPAEALSDYIHAKVMYSRDRPYASRVFANEIIRGAPYIENFLSGELRALVRRKAEVLRIWAQQGRMAPVDPAHLFSIIWAATQQYADFGVQVRAILGRRKLDDEDFEVAAETITRLVLAGCGITRGARTD
ncbi:MAG: TetR family transcriptional regulator C-terminal domain-containing protein [Alphaproteobacteria bacterium]